MDMFLKAFFKTISFAFCIVNLVPVAYGNETYYIDDSPIFLYKTINWWYDSLPKSSYKLCGRQITCKIRGNAQVKYVEFDNRLELHIEGGLASMLLAFKKCKACYGPSYFSCTWLDQRFFHESLATVRLNDSSTISAVTFSNIKLEQARHVRSVAPALLFVLNGVIGGLSNDQIALHESDDLLKKCNINDRRHAENYPITLNIINTRTGEIIAIFDMHWDR